MLRQNADTEVLWCMPMLPLCAWPLSLIAAAQGGLVVVKTAEALEQALFMLADLAMVELYSFSDALLPSVQDHVVRYRWRSRVGRVIGGDPGYFCFGMDGDWEEPPAWYSYGRACPVEIQDALKGY
jgi:hypothetical protein